MDKEEISRVLDQLAAGELEAYKVSKEEFMAFREQLIERPDFKHFRGTAEHNAEVIYTYTEEPRS